MTNKEYEAIVARLDALYATENGIRIYRGQDIEHMGKDELLRALRYAIDKMVRQRREDADRLKNAALPLHKTGFWHRVLRCVLRRV